MGERGLHLAWVGNFPTVRFSVDPCIVVDNFLSSFVPSVGSRRALIFWMMKESGDWQILVAILVRYSEEVFDASKAAHTSSLRIWPKALSTIKNPLSILAVYPSPSFHQATRKLAQFHSSFWPTPTAHNGNIIWHILNWVLTDLVLKDNE